jgi:hypothetical protein
MARVLYLEAFVDIGRDALTIRGDQIEFAIPAPLPGTFRGKIEILGLPAWKPRSGPCPIHAAAGTTRVDRTTGAVGKRLQALKERASAGNVL